MLKSAEKKKFSPWIRYTIMLLFGGGTGLGGWQLKDHPLIQGLYTQAFEPEAGGGPLSRVEKIRKVADVIKTLDAYIEPGDFEVRVAKIRLEPGTFKHGQKVDLQVRLIKRDAEHVHTTVWDSQGLGENRLVVGRAQIETGWDEPVRVGWKPGDVFVLEVWDRGRIFDKKLFEWASVGGRVFPLRSGSYALAHVEHGGDAPALEGNELVLESKPEAASVPSSRVADHEDETIKIR
ncbi:hypothetical protein EP7_000322 [Isosphaeraceae bacterium EP7]